MREVGCWLRREKISDKVALLELDIRPFEASLAPQEELGAAVDSDDIEALIGKGVFQKVLEAQVPAGEVEDLQRIVFSLCREILEALESRKLLPARPGRSARLAERDGILLVEARVHLYKCSGSRSSHDVPRMFLSCNPLESSTMEELLCEILEILRRGETLDARRLELVINRANARAHAHERLYAKKKILPFYLRVKSEEPERWKSWGIDDELERGLFETLRVKPRRTASGVATITVITRPWTCAGNCIYCPNDLRMPKSYLHDEPACRRAEQNFFDPYLQVASRLRALTQMGHSCDKVELIVLGGSWTDYPKDYQIWFVSELFRALNEGGDPDEVARRRNRYEHAGISIDQESRDAYVRPEQDLLVSGSSTFNASVRRLYGADSLWGSCSSWQKAAAEDLFALQQENEWAEHRVVGLVVETRPDAITPKLLFELRQMGCTKVQIGVQSLDDAVLAANARGICVETIAHAFALLRLFGFKIHAHFMVNLLGSTPQADKDDYRRLVTDRRFCPDEIKLYPCALIGNTELERRYEAGDWQPYDEDTLIDVLACDVRETPAYCRVSRMIRDFSSGDIVAGNKKANLRQLVEDSLEQEGGQVNEIRMREVSTSDVEMGELSLEELGYVTSTGQERFLQWVTPDGSIAGFLRLSLPDQEIVAAQQDKLAIRPGEAMIREVHIYGRASRLEKEDAGVQHRGLGKRLVERAKEVARTEGYERLNVISAVGTRGYYRKLGFSDGELYQHIDL
jgi:elongator complex protein 3